MADSLKFKSFTSLLSQSIQFISALVITPYVISHLGENLFSLWVVFLTWVSFEGLFLLGTPTGLNRYVPFFLGKKDEESLSSFLRSHFLFYFFVCLVIGFLFYFCRNLLFEFFDIPSEFFDVYQDGLFWMYLGLCASILGKVFVGLNNGRENYVYYNALMSFTILFRLAVIVLFIHKGFLVMPVAYFLSQLLLLLGLLVAFFKDNLVVFKNFNFKQDRNSLKVGLIFGAGSMLMYISDILRHQLDTLIILKSVDLASVTHYKIGTTLITSINSLSAGLFGVILTRLSFHQGSQEHGKFQELSLRSYFYSSFLASYFILGIALLSDSFLNLWIGNYDKRSLEIIYILLIPQLLMLTQYPSINVMYSIGKQKVLGLLTLIESLINFVISIILVQKLGIIGVVIGTGVGFVLSKGIVIPILLKKYCNLSLGKQASQIVPHFLIATFCFCFLWFSFNQFSLGTLLIDFIFKCFLVTLVFFIVTKIFYRIFPKEEAGIFTLDGVRRVFK